MSKQPLMVFENVDTAPRIRLARVFGVDWMATPWGVPGALGVVAAGTIVGFLLFAGTPTQRLLAGLALGVLVEATPFLHSIGHIVGGAIVDARMQAVLITGTRQINLYFEDPPDLPPRVHLARALGGPLTNLLVGALAAVLWWRVGGLLTGLFAAMNLAAAFGSLSPLPSVDGEVILRELARLRRGRDSA